MKKSSLTGIFLLFIVTLCFTQSNDKNAIHQTITLFAAASDNSDAQEVSKYLDSNYRIVMNRLFGSHDVVVLSRKEYLDKIRTKEFGGDERELKIDNVTLNGATAQVKVTFNGLKASYVSLVTLIKDDNGNWKLVNETPIFI